MSRYELRGFYYEYSVQDLEDNRAVFMSIGQKKFVLRYFLKQFIAVLMILFVLALFTALFTYHWYISSANQTLTNYLGMFGIAFVYLIDTLFVLDFMRQIINLRQDLAESRVSKFDGMEAYRKFLRERRGIYMGMNQNWFLQPRSNSKATVYAMPRLKLILSWEYLDFPLAIDILHEIEGFTKNAKAKSK